MQIDHRAVQRRLNELGFGPLAVDGINGPRTSAAIIAFKRSIGFKATSYIGPLTLAALFEPVTESDLPWMTAAAQVKGLHESRDRAELMGWFDRPVRINPREIPWCGAFVATCLRRWQPGIALPQNPLGARAWQTWGRAVPPQFGSVLVFWRGSRSGWQGHVGFCWGEDTSAFHVLGGNQSDAVTVTRIAKDRLLGSRWPENFAAPGKVIRLTAAGAPLSTNEA